MKSTKTTLCDGIMQLKKLMTDSKFQTNLHPYIKFLTSLLKRMFHLDRSDKFYGGKMRDVENLGKSKAERGDVEPSWKPEPELKPDVITLRENAANLQYIVPK